MTWLVLGCSVTVLGVAGCGDGDNAKADADVSNADTTDAGEVAGETTDDSVAGETSEDSVDGETMEDSVDGETMEDSVDGETVEDSVDGETVEDSVDGETVEDSVDGETMEDSVDPETMEDSVDGETTEDSVADTSDGTPCPELIVRGPEADSSPDRIETVRDPATSKCYLDQDVDGLLETVVLPSGTSLDCRGHKITAATPGVSGDATSRSLPELAIFLDGVDGTLIEGCVLEGFDHGILAVENKAPDAPSPTNRILDNTIEARFVAIHLARSDWFLIEGNRVTWTTRGGVGVLVHYDSDHNEVKDNVVVGQFASSTRGALLFPGPTATDEAGVIARPFNSNPVYTGGHGAILVLQILGPHPHLFNTIVGDRLIQLADGANDVPDENFTADNLVAGNSITFTGPHAPEDAATEDGIVCANSVRTTVRGNTIGTVPPDAGTHAAIRTGAVRPTPPNERKFPGACSLDASRRCLSDFDCNVPEIDVVALGVCEGSTGRMPDWHSQDWLVEGNTILPPVQIGISSNSSRAIVRNNEITGPLLPPIGTQPMAAFVFEGKYAVETEEISGNTVTDCATVMHVVKEFQGLSPDSFGARISGNNFSGYDVAIRTDDDFDLPSELSVDGKGNYWGLSCEEGGFDPEKVLKNDGSVNPNLVDSHPYGAAIPENGEAGDTCF